MSKTRNVAILIFDEVEVLDFCGPFEVFSVTGMGSADPPFNVYTIAQAVQPIASRNLLSINPGYTLDGCPAPDILVVPGGQGTRHQMHNAGLIEWIKRTAAACEVVLSVCTGALLLAKASLLDGLQATTHHSQVELLRQLAPTAKVVSGVRLTDNGSIITSGGISAGIDASFHVVARLLGTDAARQAAAHMEYAWTPNPP